MVGINPRRVVYYETEKERDILIDKFLGGNKMTANSCGVDVNEVEGKESGIVLDSEKIYVFSKPNCAQCNMTKTFLDNNGVKYVNRSVEYETNLNHLKSMGYQSVPIIIKGDKVIKGFAPDELGALV